MENESLACGVCFIPYDADDHLPRVLIDCGHTLCSSCLTEIIKSPQLRKCPFDKFEFEKAQKSIENFPVNFALLALLEGRNQNSCKIHNEPLTMICLKDRSKICNDCAIFGKHNGHPVKKIKDLKANGMKLKKSLEESLVQFKKGQLERDEEMDRKRQEYLSKMKSKLEEIRNIWKKKESEWEEEIDNLFEKNIRNHRLLLKREAEKALEEISQACQKEETNLAIWDESLSSIISRLQSQNLQEEPFKILEKNSRTIDCLESFLVSQTKSIQNFDLKPEKPGNDMIQKSFFLKAKTLLRSRFRENTLFLSVDNPNPVDMAIDLGAQNKIKKVSVFLDKYLSFFQDSVDFHFLSEILYQLNTYTSLVVSFAPENPTDDLALNLLNSLFCRIQHLTEIEINFEGCEIANQPVSLFCNKFLPKAHSLTNLTVKLGWTSISDLNLFELAQSLSSLGQSLQIFTLGAGHTAITGDGIWKLVRVILRVKELNLQLQETLITDQSLKVLGNQLTHLKKFTLDVRGTKITMEGVNAILVGIPKEIKWLNLDFSHMKLSDQVVSLFEQKVCPKLEFAEDVHIRLEGTDLAAKMPNSLRSIIKEAEKRLKAHQ